ncbi:MAG: 16S rRNA (cytidine(1402)-2'-O)-methyltransferase [Bacillota bacterium]|nr:16S rRNA (cytidine(1402)-2'-O)-methyltransferase [Bacillota bacterium]
MIVKKGALYLVGTPLGNLEDMSPRAQFILRECDFIAAEDTRVTAKLLSVFNIKKPLISYYEHNIRERGEEICARLEKNECCALVTDAGMPAISDPGEDIVRLCGERGIEVFAVPGPSAVVTALALSGLPTGRFTFEGFLTKAHKNRMQHLNDIKEETRTMVFYEAPHKLKETLRDLYDTLGDRKISIAREMTKLHEEVIRTTLSQAIQIYEEKPPKGEFVLVIDGMPKKAPEHPDLNDISLKDKLIADIDMNIKLGLPKNAAVKKTADTFNLSRNEVYKICFTD